ncbi:DUF3649 domain-containing protein [Ottowia testudinis]|uniref:DUF3649 domain-containing protein n=1 Tax=Ottowia testudinis TaxID=2816950 RepID=A0A975CBY1_9BURK|nr:DUF3649 domain-containing protein [Ottowia testudinis]
MRHPPPSLASALPVLARVASAVLGGYALTVLTAIALAGVLPLSRADGVLTGMLAAFPLYAAAVMWVFAAKSARLACLGMLGAVVLAGAAAWVAT